MENTKRYWTNRYTKLQTGWDIGYVSTPIKEYIDQLQDKHIEILIPGAGNAYEAEYLFKQGFDNVYVLDISEEPLEAFSKRNPIFPHSNLLCYNFFTHKGQYDLILEQTFFCSFPPLPKYRHAYAKTMHDLLKNGGKLAGLWFNASFKGSLDSPPYGGDKMEYLRYLNPYFKVRTFKHSHNSIPQRQGNELFGIFEKE